jgi:hypothetical protein
MKNLLSLLICCLLALPAFGAEYWVVAGAAGGGNGSQGTPWDELSDAINASLLNGDIVYCTNGNVTALGGTLTETDSGITYVSVGWRIGIPGSARIRCPITFSGSNCRLIGFDYDGAFDARGVKLANGVTGLELWHNFFRGFLLDRDVIWTDQGSKSEQAHGITAIANVFSNIVTRAFQTRGSNHFMAYNEAMALQEDFIYWFGPRQQAKNNLIWKYDVSDLSSSGPHCDVFQFGTDALGFIRSVREANTVYSTNGFHIHISNESGTGVNSNHIWRANIWNKVGDYTYGMWGTDFDHIASYNDTTVGAAQASGQAANTTGMFNRGQRFSFQGHITVDGWGTSVTTAAWYGDSPMTLEDHDWNLLYDTSAAINYSATLNGEANTQLNTDPDFVSLANLDFRLSSSSPARGAGGRLTLANGSGSGSTTLIVDGGFKLDGDNPDISAYGGALVIGEQITFNGQTRRVVSVSGNTLTLDTAADWSDNELIYYGTDTTPDLGAIPFDTVALISGTWSRSGNTITGVPNSSNDVRWMVLYINDYPYAVDPDGSDGWQLTAPASGTVRVLFYKLTAVTLVSGVMQPSMVEATEGEGETTFSTIPGSGKLGRATAAGQ